MSKPLCTLLGAFCAACALAAGAPASGRTGPADASGVTSSQADAPSSAQLERELQSLTWEQFRTVVRAIPKLKADVDAYGPLGWEYARANYRTHSWKNSLDKLDDERKRQLADLVRQVRDGAPSSSD